MPVSCREVAFPSGFVGTVMIDTKIYIFVAILPQAVCRRRIHSYINSLFGIPSLRILSS